MAGAAKFIALIGGARFPEAQHNGTRHILDDTGWKRACGLASTITGRVRTRRAS